MRSSICFFLLLISGLRMGFYAQTAAQCMDFAREQVAAGNDTLALKIYQRVLFFDRKTFGTACYQALGGITQRLGDYSKSAFYYDLLYQKTRIDTVRYAAILGKCGALLLQEKYKEASAELLALPADLPPYWMGRMQLYRGAALYGDHDFEGAEAAFLTLIPTDSIGQRKALHDLLRKARRYDRKQARTAQTLSLVLPGLGQFYAGDFRNGINSLTINGLTIWWLVYAAQNASLPDAILSVGSIAFRYYQGGYQRAGLIAEAQKTKRLKKNMGQILSLLR